MILRIARKEFIEMCRDGRFRSAAVLVFLLLLAALSMGWKHYRDVSHERETATQVMRQQWLQQGEKHPHAAAHYGIYAFRPIRPLSLIDQGLEPYLGSAVWLEAHKQNQFQYRQADGTAIQRFGALTAAGVLQLLLPLLIILLSFSAFTSEREQGTLRQILSLGVTPRELAIGKGLGIAGALSLLLLPATVIGVAAAVLASPAGVDSATAGGVVIMGIGYLIYFAIFLCLSLAVSAAAPSSRVALVVVLAFWIANGLLVPRSLSNVAGSLYPTPSAFAFAQAVSEDIAKGPDSHNPNDPWMEQVKTRLLRQYGVNRVEDLPISFDGIQLQEGENYGNQVFDRHYGRLWDTFERQNRVHQFAAVLSPLLAVRSLSMGMAGTDFVHHRHFAGSAEDFRRLLIRVINDDITDHSRSGDMAMNPATGASRYLSDRRLWERVPAFDYHPPSLMRALMHEGVSVGILLLWCAGAGAVAWKAAGHTRIE